MDFLNVMGNNCSGSHANVLLKHPKHTSHGQGMKAPVQSWRAAMLKRFSTLYNRSYGYRKISDTF